jgi:Ca-activated chloride channel family protein
MLYSDTRLFAGLSPSWRVRIRYTSLALRVIAWLLLVIALARPQTGNSQAVIRGQGVDIVLALDISTSMAALDFQPQNRLEAAKIVMTNFIEAREFDRIGLVVFARNAYQQSPLTLDYPILIRLLDQVSLVSDLRQIEGRSLDGTALGLGIASAANLLRNDDTASKVIILLTDGANNAGIDPLHAAAASNALGIHVYTIGVGSLGIINVPDRDGNIVSMESDLNEGALRNIAQSANGQYFRAENAEEWQQIYDAIDALERSDVERRVVVQWSDYAFKLLPIALALLLLERILQQTVFQFIP